MNRFHFLLICTILSTFGCTQRRSPAVIKDLRAAHDPRDAHNQVSYTLLHNHPDSNEGIGCIYFEPAIDLEPLRKHSTSLKMLHSVDIQMPKGSEKELDLEVDPKNWTTP